MAKGAAAALADALTAVVHTPDAPEHGRVGQRISMHKDNVPWPAFDAATLANAIRWLIALLVLAGLAWVVSEAVRRSRARRQ